MVKRELGLQVKFQLMQPKDFEMFGVFILKRSSAARSLQPENYRFRTLIKQKTLSLKEKRSATLGTQKLQQYPPDV